MSRKAPFISRKHALGDWGTAKYDDNFFFDEVTKEWEEESDKAMALLSEMLSEIFQWLSDGNMHDKRYTDCISRKTIALIWCMRPDLFENKSLREISRMSGVGFSVASISKHATYFTEKFGRFHNGTKSDDAKRNYRDSAYAMHAKRKEECEKQA